MGGNMGGLIATWSFLPSHAPNYIRLRPPAPHPSTLRSLFLAGNALNLGTSTITLFAVLGLLLYQYRANKSHASGKNDHLLEDKTEEQQQELGVHHPEFRYRY